jgi:hypothetical protein
VDGPTRRVVLATGGALALAACLPAENPQPPRPDPDLRLRRAVAAEVRVLVAAYAAVAAAVPDAGSARLARLRSLAAEHEAHVVALEGPQPTASPSGSPSASTSTGSPSPSAPPPQVPATPAAAVTWLTGLERAAADRRTGQVLKAGADLGRLLASIAACESTHADLLVRENQ